MVLRALLAMAMAMAALGGEAIAAPDHPAPTDPAPTDPTPAAPAPTDPAPDDPAPADPAAPRMPESPPASEVRDNSLLLTYSKAAHDAAQSGHCEVLAEITPKVRALDPTFYDLVYSVDPPIAACFAGLPPPKPKRLAPPVCGPLRKRPYDPLLAPPVTKARIAAELFVGAIVGGGGALVGALVGSGICGGRSSCLDQAMIAAYIAGTLTVPLGVAAMGNQADQEGSLGMTYAGSVLGALGGALLLASGEDEITLVGLLLGPPVGAVIGFNATRRYRPGRAPAVGSLIHVDHRGASLAIPVVTRAASADRTVTNIPLLGGTF